MEEHSSTASVAPPPTPMQTVFMIAVLIPIVAGYYILGGKIGVQALFMGFLFSTYWGAVRMLAIPDYLPTVLGGLTGIGLAYLFCGLPAVMGTPGVFAALAATIVSMYFMIRQQGQLFLNPSFIVFLTVATIPAIGKQQHDYLDMAIGLLFGAVYSRVIVFVLAKIAAMRQPKPEPVIPATGQA